MSSDKTCADKISANIAISMKFDPKTGNWYIKDMQLSHAMFIDSAKVESIVYKKSESITH